MLSRLSRRPDDDRTISLLGGECRVPHPGGGSHLRKQGDILTNYGMYQIVDISIVLFSDHKLMLLISATAVRCCVDIFDAPKGVVERAFG